ncbi:MAG: 50S ribosomal protein L21 [Calditrichaeota bacterium]|nr:50S ribosomal protein L21 [Calditrichota bacterium]
MFALVKIAGRQYRVAPEQKLTVEKLTVPTGGEYVVQDVMMVVDGERVEVGQPRLPYRVTLELLSQKPGERGVSYRFFRRGGRRVKRGWRHQQTFVRVKSIEKEASNGS